MLNFFIINKKRAQNPLPTLEEIKEFISKKDLNEYIGFLND